MQYNFDCGKLFDGLADAVAKVVREDASGTPIMKLDCTRPCVYEVVGNAAAKTDVPMLEVEVEDGFPVRLELEDARRVIQMQKEASRTEMYKQKYEDSEAQLEEERLDREDERQAWDEERKRLEKKIIQLEAQLAYAKENPQNQTIVFNEQQTTSTEVHSEVKMEMKVLGIKIEEQGAGTKPEKEECNESGTKVERTHVCSYFVEEKANNYRYQKSLIDLDNELRIGFRAKNKMPAFVHKVQKWNNDGVLLFKGSDLHDIFDEFIYCYYDKGELTDKEIKEKWETFRKACVGWTPK